MNHNWTSAERGDEAVERIENPVLAVAVSLLAVLIGLVLIGQIIARPLIAWVVGA